MSPATQPLIGITSGQVHNTSGIPVTQIGRAYIAAVVRAGGLPLILPVGIAPTAAQVLLNRLDGLLVSGGGDIDPQRFNGNRHPMVGHVSAERDALEIALVKTALVSHKPLLAICRGIQVLNVALGGTLFTHIPDQVENALKHDWYPDFPRDKIAHPITLTNNSLLRRIYGAAEIQVNSLHHQGVSKLGNGLTPTAFAPDGLVEGVEVDGAAFAIGVQWHPECLPDDAGTQSLFKAFINACVYSVETTQQAAMNNSPRLF